MGVRDGEARLGEGGRAIGVTKFANADEAGCESWDNVARARLG